MVFVHDSCRSCRQGSSLYLSRNGQIYQYQTYAEITSVSPNTGSIEGCTKVTITGRNFDETKSKSQVFVGGDHVFKKKNWGWVGVGVGGGNNFWCFYLTTKNMFI